MAFTGRPSAMWLWRAASWPLARLSALLGLTREDGDAGRQQPAFMFGHQATTLDQLSHLRGSWFSFAALKLPDVALIACYVL